MDEGALISAMTQKGHTQSTAQATIEGRKKDPQGLQNLWNEYMGAPATTSTGQSSGEFLKKQGEEFLSQAGDISTKGVEAFTSGYQGLVGATTDLTNLEPLRASAQQLTETLMAMPKQIETAGQAVGMTQQQLQGRMAKKLAEFAPSAQEAQRQYEYALGEFDRLMSLGMAPLEVAYSAVGESLRRLETVFSVGAENQLQLNLQELVNKGAMDIEKLKETGLLARAEMDFLATDWKTIDGRLVLVNKNTGETIKDYGVQGTGDAAGRTIKDAPNKYNPANRKVLQELEATNFRGSSNPIQQSTFLSPYWNNP